MISNIQKVKKARELRLSGESLSEINKKLNIPISTLSFWLRDITLNEKQLVELEGRVMQRVNRGRLNASISNRSKRIFKEKKIYDEASREFTILVKEPYFIFGLSLYLAKGVKKGTSFQFSSSNDSLIKIMSKWVKKYLKVEDSQIKQRKYGKIMRLEIAGIQILRRLIAWQKLLIGYYDSV